MMYIVTNSDKFDIFFKDIADKEGALFQIPRTFCLKCFDFMSI